MSEIKKTIAFAGAAAAFALLALVTAPKRVIPEAFSDRGDQFFAAFTDPNEARSLEVIEFDEATGAARPFKVAVKGGLWTIPSHHDYPADGEDRLAKTAAGVIGITKDDFRSDSVSDHELCSVVDPLDDATASPKGRGRRITLKGANDQILADFIVGDELPERENMRFVRVPGEKRVYAARMDVDISSQFHDWIERDLLELDKDSLESLTLRDYRIDETTAQVEAGDTIGINKDGDDWKIVGMAATEEVDSAKIQELLTAIADLSIVGVRPKPAGLTASLKTVDQGLRVTQADLVSLQGKGFYLSREGSLLSNEGEVQAATTEGVQYTLRFGEIVYGSGATVTAGDDSSDDEAAGPGENRYLFVTAELAPELRASLQPPASTDYKDKDEAEWTDEDRNNKAQQEAYDEWKARVASAQGTVTHLNDRFAKWYDVIPASAFDQMKRPRSELVKEKES